MQIMNVPQYGPIYRFNDANLYWALHVLSFGKRMGRKRLSALVGVGEGSMRKILNTLKDWGFVDVRQTGITITAAGLQFLQSIPIKPIDMPNMPGSFVGEFVQGILVKGKAQCVANGMEQRDAGIRAGASGCTTIVFRDGSLMIPPDWNIDEKQPEAAKELRNTGMTDEDVIVVGSGRSFEVAMEAALKAAFEMI